MTHFNLLHILTDYRMFTVPCNPKFTVSVRSLHKTELVTQ